MRMLLAALCVAPWIVACSSPASESGSDAAPDGSPSDAQTGQDGKLANDATTATDAATGDAPGSDAGPLGPNPPQGAKLCGSGTFGQTQAVQTCQQSGLLSYGPLVADCGGVSMTSGHWEAWCATTAVYMWAEFDGLSTGSSSCPFYFLDPDYEYGNGGGNTGNSGANGYASVPYDEIGGAASVDAAVWVTLPNAAVPGSGALYIGTTLDPMCATDAYVQDLMLGAALTWK